MQRIRPKAWGVAPCAKLAPCGHAPVESGVTRTVGRVCDVQTIDPHAQGSLLAAVRTVVLSNQVCLVKG